MILRAGEAPPSALRPELAVGMGNPLLFGLVSLASTDAEDADRLTSLKSPICYLQKETSLFWSEMAAGHWQCCRSNLSLPHLHLKCRSGITFVRLQKKGEDDFLTLNGCVRVCPQETLGSGAERERQGERKLRSPRPHSLWLPLMHVFAAATPEGGQMDAREGGEGDDGDDATDDDSIPNVGQEVK